ncbi:MAG: C40 family peptidase [Gordonia polyisoprenivorans]|nr:C40 family peptidase [Gordonia polyisoprenivorans]
MTGMLGVLFLPVLMFMALGGGASSVCGTPTPQLGMAGAQSPVAGFTARQTQIAATIVGHVNARNLGVPGAVVALTVGFDESGLRNLANSKVPESLAIPHDGVGSDGHSVGIMQQQFDQGWGTVAELMNPAIATDKFLDALVKVPGWQTMDPAVAATTVQNNRDGAAPYVQHVPVAQRMLAALQGNPAAVDLANSAVDEDNPTGNAAGTCPTAPGGGAIDPANIPNFVPGGPVGPNIVAAAASQMGIRYSWGGGDLNGPTVGIHDGGAGDAHMDYAIPGWDCSGLAQFAVYKATGKKIPDVSETQSANGEPVADEAAAQPGDLVFFGGQGVAHHVGIYIGGGKMINAPQSGTKVRIDNIKGFDSPITFRRYS